jgi:uncharacterized glyoxalase superfamily protein PhnB/uncharacterized protein YndB with AHSA1/START domain
MATNEAFFSKDPKNKKLTVVRAFDAPLDPVWRAWTESEILDKWWAPKPYRAETKKMDFRAGGIWLYAMVGPEGDRQNCRVDYHAINPKTSIKSTDGFCDENGNSTVDFPKMHLIKNFSESGAKTTVTVEVTFDEESDMEQYLKAGFQEGFTAGLSNLDQYLSTHFQLRKEGKTSSSSRVTTYLNFPGKTEEAFNFYKEVFNGTFTGAGLTRFGDTALPEGIPPMSDADKKLIIHAELTIMGGHVLMATDSPESMGFKMEHGNNMHINVEPDSREETKRIFDQLSAGGIVTMPLDDMFWGAYYAAFTDKFGINWMLNYQNK